MSEIHGPVVTFISGEALAAKRRVKIKSGTTTTPPEVVYADAGEQHIGVTEYAVAITLPVAIRMRSAEGTMECEAAGAFSVAATLYGAADGKIDDASSGSAIGIAKEEATASGDIVEFVEFGVMSTTAATVSIADAGGHTAQTDVEAATQELYQHMLSTQALINCPMGAWHEQDGTALAAFADGASPTPGISAGDEGYGIRWNNHANPDPVSISVPIHPDLDETANVIVHVLAAKVGATVGDAVTWLIEAFNNLDGALYDADADFGGTSSAMTGDATSKTCQEETLILASANVAAAPGTITLTLQPTDGTLGTDDVIVLGVWLEYTRKILTG